VQTSTQSYKDMKETDMTLFLPQETITVDKHVSSCLLFTLSVTIKRSVQLFAVLFAQSFESSYVDTI